MEPLELSAGLLTLMNLRAVARDRRRIAVAPGVIDKLHVLAPLSALAAIDALLGAQAVDLREPCPRSSMGKGAARLYEALRAKVPMLDIDRPPGPDIETAMDVLQNLCRSRESLDYRSRAGGNQATSDDCREPVTFGERHWVPASAGTTNA